jgi:hypothetical protein
VDAVISTRKINGKSRVNSYILTYDCMAGIFYFFSRNQCCESVMYIPDLEIPDTKTKRGKELFGLFVAIFHKINT